MLQQVQSYADLRKQIHDDLRLQHPEWIPAQWQVSDLRFLRGAPVGIAGRLNRKGAEKISWRSIAIG